MARKKLITIISPAFNEEKNVSNMVREVGKYIPQKYLDYEYIFVDDGSTDDTWSEIQKISRKNKHIKGLKLTRNFGQQAAIAAGIDIAKGDAVIYCDSDLQQPPRLFPKLIAHWGKGARIVHTKRVETLGISPFKNIMSKLFYFFVNTLSDTYIEEGMADFKLLDKEVYTKLKSMKEKNRFLRGMVSWMGYPSATVSYKAGRRVSGLSRYNLERSIELAKIGIISLSTKPLKYILYFGLILILLSVLGLTGVTITIIYERDLRFFSPTIVLVIFNTLLIGFVIVCLGIVALYISYLHKEIINRPVYIVSEKANVK